MNKPRLYKTIIFLVFAFLILPFGFCLLAQDAAKVADLRRQIIEAKDNNSLYESFEELKSLYFPENKYSEFVDFISSLVKQRKSLEPVAGYYVGLSRFTQLKYLEEKQDWNEYFGQGDAYRNQIMVSLQKSIDGLTPKDMVYIYAKLLLWHVYKEAQDPLTDEVLISLVGSVKEYAKDSKRSEPIKDVANQILAEGENLKAKELYKVYVDKLVTSDLKDIQLEGIALAFLKEGNLDLAELVYDIYIDKLLKLPKEQSIPMLMDIAKYFVYKDNAKVDPAYAEKIFSKIDFISGGKDAFNEETLYLRGFNLEKMKEYEKAKDIYWQFIKAYPDSPKMDEVNYKLAAIFIYVLGDRKLGESYFLLLAEKNNAYALNSLYQLGLLKQWDQDYVKAKEYYERLVAKTSGGIVVDLANQRLTEIAENKSLEYATKTFLDATFKDDSPAKNISFGVNVSVYNPQKNDPITITSSSLAIASGCIPVEKQYLWSGDFVQSAQSLNQPSFTISFPESGTKLVFLVVVVPSGILERSIEFLDVR